MANIATTTFKVLGSRKAVNDLWATLQQMEVNSKKIWLGDLARHYGIDYEARHIMVRGSIYWAEYEEDPSRDCYLLSFETESAWNEPDELFQEIKHLLWDELEINYRVTECGCEVFHVHQESGYDFFPEECCVSSYGTPFDEVCEEMFDTISDAVREWCTRMGIEQGERTNDEMVEFINGYEYDDAETYFYIHPFTFG